ncbi:hypothetical protein GGS26DRAFT_564141 [Hypomontagnella submonticulosa]|nr:hypothetical protein GGS26DRAFT_564141 [Hypomontagnella submonticulosa]
MRSTIHVAAAIAVTVFNVMTMANPVDQRDVGVLEYRDGLDYHTWVARQVEDGKLFWANDTTEQPVERDLEGRGVTATIKNAACSKVIGDQPSYVAAKEWWCDWADDIEKAMVIDAQAYVTDTICGGIKCRLYMGITWRKTGVFQSGQFKNVCNDIFDTLYRQCLGGGTGTVLMNDGGQTWEGTVTIDWLENAEVSKTCPHAPKPSITCNAHV